GQEEGEQPSVRVDYGSAKSIPQSPSVTAVDRFEDAILQALNGGKKSTGEVFKVARQQLGFSRLGNQIRTSLEDALRRLEKRNLILIEEDEIFFANPEARSACYTVTDRLRSDGRRGFRRYK